MRDLPETTIEKVFDVIFKIALVAVIISAIILITMDTLGINKHDQDIIKMWNHGRCPNDNSVLYLDQVSGAGKLPKFLYTFKCKKCNYWIILEDKDYNMIVRKGNK